MGTNVIQLADYLVPSYRRTRRNGLSTASGAAAPLSWSAMARARVASRATGAAADVIASVPCDASRVHAMPAADSADTPPIGARLRLSGRLIDVCAELERLAAAEAAASLPRRA